MALSTLLDSISAFSVDDDMYWIPAPMACFKRFVTSVDSISALSIGNFMH
jgi:hypothetical protein